MKRFDSYNPIVEWLLRAILFNKNYGNCNSDGDIVILTETSLKFNFVAAFN